MLTEDEKFDKFLDDIESHIEEVYKLAEIEFTPENIEISDKIFKVLICAYRDDIFSMRKRRYRYSEFKKWLSRKVK